MVIGILPCLSFEIHKPKLKSPNNNFYTVKFEVALDVFKEYWIIITWRVNIHLFQGFELRFNVCNYKSSFWIGEMKRKIVVTKDAVSSEALQELLNTAEYPHSKSQKVSFSLNNEPLEIFHAFSCCLIAPSRLMNKLLIHQLVQ